MTMAQIPPTILTFLVEALILALVVLLVIAWRWSRQQRRELQAAQRLVERLRQVTAEHRQTLLASLGEENSEEVEATVEREKDLYRQILKVFLERDVRLLPKLDEQVQALGESHRRLQAQAMETPSDDPAAMEALQQAQARVQQLEAELAALGERLQVATDTIERLSAEYTRMFAPDRTTEELEASRRRILETLRASQRRLQADRQASPGETPQEPRQDDDIVIIG